MGKRILSIFVVLCVCMQVFAYDFFVYNNDGVAIYYKITSHVSPRTVEVTRNYPFKYTGNVDIPQSVSNNGTNYTVTRIGRDAFGNSIGLTSVTMPNTVTSIGISAFESCSGLTSINFPDSITTIEFGAFMNCSGLTSIALPKTVTNINAGAFWGCSGLTSIYIPASVTSLGLLAFNNCSNLNTITVSSANTIYDSRNNCNAIIETSSNKLLTGCKTTIIPNTVTNIGICAFEFCTDLTDITIPNSVTNISYYAFGGCSGLTGIVIPSSVTNVEDSAFYQCSGLDTIIVASGNTVYDSRNNCNAIIKTSTNKLITGCKNTIIPNSVTSIEAAAFNSCIGLTSIAIPNSVTAIEEGAFANCPNLDTIIVASGNAVYDSRNNCNAIIEKSTNSLVVGCKTTIIPNTVKSVGNYAFKSCTSLTSISIPKSVINIGISAFSGCTDLKSITSFATTAPQIGPNAFENVDDTIPVFIPCGSLQSYRSVWSCFSNFIEMIPYSFLAISADENMGIVNVTDLPSCDNNLTASITAIANPGYQFTRWSDGNTQNPRVINITSDVTIMAYFSEATGVDDAVLYSELYTNENTIYINGAEGEALVIYDVYGRVIYKEVIENNKPYELPQPGVYVVKIGDRATQKIVIK